MRKWFQFTLSLEMKQFIMTLEIGFEAANASTCYGSTVDARIPWRHFSSTELSPLLHFLSLYSYPVHFSQKALETCMRETLGYTILGVRDNVDDRMYCLLWALASSKSATRMSRSLIFLLWCPTSVFSSATSSSIVSQVRVIHASPQSRLLDMYNIAVPLKPSSSAFLMMESSSASWCVLSNSLLLLTPSPLPSLNLAKKSREE